MSSSEQGKRLFLKSNSFIQKQHEWCIGAYFCKVSVDWIKYEEAAAILGSCYFLFSKLPHYNDVIIYDFMNCM